ncbi:MAG TPA: MSMEG_0567/Sll0786 family nitrogen starvation N-acetyltransferase [Solirubrobacteraceae bacterium]|nr:MSMEG_0567/Sll0786 family nitrogen starvation N-acetyltransferase [Solirubrobacteraceae bacterium]
MAISSSAPSTLPDRAPLACGLARGRAELDEHFAVRRRIFVAAQGLFADDDRDAHDDDPATLHAVARSGGDVAGAVRLYPLDGDGLWKGDRLAVLPAERALQLGAMLVRFAVRTAGERGGRLMIAQVQVPNVRFFERLGWSADGDVTPMFGVDHQPMAIALGAGSGRGRGRTAGAGLSPGR